MGAHKTPTGTKEWAKHNWNVCVGCSNNCRYCYAREMALRFKQVKSEEEWKQERIVEKKVEKIWHKKEGTIMFPTTHDITDNNLDACLITLGNMLRPGNRVLIVSKPRIAVIRLLLQELKNYASQVLFRFTIGNLSHSITKYWEKDTPNPFERHKCLKLAYESGFETSISCEPMLCDLAELRDLITICEPLVTDAIWIGKMNQVKRRVKIVTPEDQEQVARLEALYSDENIFKVYDAFKDNKKVKWKDSIKQVVGIEAPEETGLDI